MVVYRGTSFQATPLNHHGFQVDHGLDQGQCRKFWEKMKDEEVDRNLKAQMVEEMELAFLKNICHRRILHPLSIYKYPCLLALLLLRKTPAEENRYKEQLGAGTDAQSRGGWRIACLTWVRCMNLQILGQDVSGNLHQKVICPLPKACAGRGKGQPSSVTGSRHRAPALLPRPALVAGRQDRRPPRQLSRDDAPRRWGQREDDKLKRHLRVQPRLLRRGRGRQDSGSSLGFLPGKQGDPQVRNKV